MPKSGSPLSVVPGARRASSSSFFSVRQSNGIRSPRSIARQVEKAGSMVVGRLRLKQVSGALSVWHTGSLGLLTPTPS